MTKLLKIYGIPNNKCSGWFCGKNPIDKPIFKLNGMNMDFFCNKFPLGDICFDIFDTLNDAQCFSDWGNYRTKFFRI